MLSHKAWLEVGKCSFPAQGFLRTVWIWFNRNSLLISLFCQCCDGSRALLFLLQSDFTTRSPTLSLPEICSEVLHAFEVFLNLFLKCLKVFKSDPPAWVSVWSINQSFLYRNFPFSNILSFYLSYLSTALPSVSFIPWNNPKFHGSLSSIRM